MVFKSLNQVLSTIEKRDSWREQQQFRRILAVWPEAVGLVVSAQTRPIAIQRGVLRVATSSSVWAQNLLFERPRILEKLNTYLATSLMDIRFSTADWSSIADRSGDYATRQNLLWQQHPSRTLPVVSQVLDQPQTSAQSFQLWAKELRQQSQQSPLCPECHSPTPEGELKRWLVCSLCARKKMKS